MYGMMYKCSAASYHVQESNQQLALVNGLELDQNKRVTGLFTVLGQYIQKQQQQQQQMKLQKPTLLFVHMIMFCMFQSHVYPNLRHICKGFC